MGGDPDDVRRKFIDNPKGQALQADRVKGGRAVVNAKSDQPEVRFGVTTDDIFATRNLDELLVIARESATFRKMEQQLKKRGVTVTREVTPLDKSTGGGTTAGNARGKGRGILIWPDSVPKTFHVLDVFIHEYGHVFEDNGGPGYQEFLNTVQDELGIRHTPDSHPPERSPAPSPLPVPGP